MAGASGDHPASGFGVAGRRQRRYDPWTMQGDAIVYEFSRPKVERVDFSAFLEQFAFERLPTAADCAR